MKRKSFSISQGSGNGIHIQFSKLKGLRKKKKFGLLKNKIYTNLFYVDVPKWTSVKLDLFPCLAGDGKSPPQRRIIIVANIFGKEVDLHWRKVCSTNSVFIIKSQKIYSRAFIRVIAQYFIAKGSNVSTKLFTRRRIKRRERRRSFSISLNFYQTILESSPQTTFTFDIKKLFLVDALTFITGQTQDDPLRITIDLPEFRRIPKRRYRCRVRPATPCVNPQLSFLLFRFVAFHYDMKVIYCGVLFPRRF